jgi:hypothetical protein
MGGPAATEAAKMPVKGIERSMVFFKIRCLSGAKNLCMVPLRFSTASVFHNMCQNVYQRSTKLLLTVH